MRGRTRIRPARRLHRSRRRASRGSRDAPSKGKRQKGKGKRKKEKGKRKKASRTSAFFLFPSNFLSNGHGIGRRDRRRRRRRLLVDQLLQLLARLEVRHLLRRHVDLVAGLRIASFPRLALAQAETAESPQLDFLTAVQRLDDAPEDGVDDHLGVLLG